MRKQLILGLMSISSTVFAANVTTGDVMEHETCAISLPASNNIEASLSAKGLSVATYKFLYQVNKTGPILTKELRTDGSNLIHRTNGVDGGEAELQSMLKAIRFSGMPELRLFQSDGTAIPVQKNETYTHIGEFIKYSAELKNSTPIRAAFVNVFEKSTLKRSDQYWHELEFQPIHEMTVIETGTFTLASVAKEILKQGSQQAERMDSQERTVLKIIAGQKVSAQEKASVSKKDLNNMQMLLVYNKLGSHLSEEEFSAKLEAAIPNCKIVK